MSVIKCKMCGGDLELIEGSSVAVSSSAHSRHNKMRFTRTPPVMS